MEHQFNVQLAQKYGIEEAILIHNLFFWINKNAANEKHLYDGSYWTYNSQKALSELFPYMNETKIQRSLKGLCDKDFIIKGNYNKNKLDRTSWYAFTKQSLCILQNAGYDVGILKNANSQYEATIPYSKHTDSNTDKEKEGTNVPKKVSVSPTKEEKEAFEMFRKKYPGQKRGLDTELSLLIKKHKDWRDVIPILSNAIDVEIRKRTAAESANDFFPKPQMLQTYINQRSWEKYIDEINPNYDNEYRPTSNGGSVHWNEQTHCYYCFNPWDFYQFTDGYTNDTRPDAAAVFCQGVKYTWSKDKKEWIQSR